MHNIAKVKKLNLVEYVLQVLLKNCKNFVNVFAQLMVFISKRDRTILNLSYTKTIILVFT